MAKHINWYLLHWERTITHDASGRRREVWVYTGDYYSFLPFPGGLRRIKACYLALAAAMLAVWAICSLVTVDGRERAYVGVAWFLCILPFMELLLGTGSMMAVKEKMTYRAMYGSYQRCKYGSSVLLVLLALSSAGQLIFLAMHASDPVVNLAAELCWLAGATVCTSCALLLVLLQRKYPPVVI